MRPCVSVTFCSDDFCREGSPGKPPGGDVRRALIEAYGGIPDDDAEFVRIALPTIDVIVSHTRGACQGNCHDAPSVDICAAGGGPLVCGDKGVPALVAAIEAAQLKYGTAATGEPLPPDTAS